MRILTVDGVEDVLIRTDKAASVLGQHWNAVQRLLYTGDDSRLKQFRRTKVAGRRLLTDPDEIERLASIGDLSFEDIYED
jgi:hypothetical protein